jgi:hypothetical protein
LLDLGFGDYNDDVDDGYLQSSMANIMTGTVALPRLDLFEHDGKENIHISILVMLLISQFWPISVALPAKYLTCHPEELGIGNANVTQ